MKTSLLTLAFTAASGLLLAQNTLTPLDELERDRPKSVETVIDPYAQLRLQGVSPGGLDAFTAAARERFVLRATKWILVTRGETAPPTWFSAPNAISDFTAVPLTNAYTLSGSLETPLTTHHLKTWCDVIVYYEDRAGAKAVRDATNQVKVTEHNPILTREQAVQIARKGFEGAAVDMETLRLSKPMVTRLEITDPADRTRDIKLPAYMVVWSDGDGGGVSATVSELSKTIVEWGVSSDHVPQNPGTWYYPKLGITNLPPAQVPPRLR